VSIFALGLLFLAGIFAGILNTIAGGGTVLTLPLLIFYGMPATVANGTNRVFMFVQSLAGTLSLASKAAVPFKRALFFSLPVLVASMIGAFIATQIHPDLLKHGVGWLILISATASLVHRFAKKRTQPPPQEPPNEETEIDQSGDSRFWNIRKIIINIGLLLVLGLYGGLIQTGLGAILLVVLTKFCGFAKLSAMTIKNAIIAFYSLPVIGIFFYYGQVAWQPGIVLAAGALVGAHIGARLATKLSLKRIMSLVYIVMIVSGIYLVWP